MSLSDALTVKTGMTRPCTNCRQTMLQMDQSNLCDDAGAGRTSCTCAPGPSETPFGDWGGRPRVPGREALACGCAACRSRSAWSAKPEMFCPPPDLQAPPDLSPARGTCGSTSEYTAAVVGLYTTA